MMAAICGIAFLCVGVSTGIGASRVAGAQIGMSGGAVIGGVGALVGGSLVSIAVNSAVGWFLAVVAAFIGSISLLFVAQLITEKR